MRDPAAAMRDQGRGAVDAIPTVRRMQTFQTDRRFANSPECDRASLPNDVDNRDDISPFGSGVKSSHLRESSSISPLGEKRWCFSMPVTPGIWRPRRGMADRPTSTRRHPNSQAPIQAPSSSALRQASSSRSSVTGMAYLLAHCLRRSTASPVVPRLGSGSATWTFGSPIVSGSSLTAGRLRRRQCPASASPTRWSTGPETPRVDEPRPLEH
jgi:hypothetical protein